MSVTNANQAEESHECGRCGEQCPPEMTVKGAFCSAVCYYRARGAKAIEQIASDHRWCATCFRRIKTVDRPPEGRLVELDVPRTIRECFIGYQYATEHAEHAIDELPTENEYRPVEITRLGCECGNADPEQRHEILRDTATKATIVSLWECLVELEREGALSQRPDKEQFFDALREHWRDWEYAVGRALHA